MLTISQLFIYPVKSLGGIEIKQTELTDRGLKYDRRWMLIDENHRFLSQREHAKMALFKIIPADNGFCITYLPDGTSKFISYLTAPGETINVSIWDDWCIAHTVSTALDTWFSDKLNFNCRLVYMPDDSSRLVDERYAKQHENVSFADAYPILMIGQEAMDQLNQKLNPPVSIHQFRPNIVFKGAEAHFEDRLAHFAINGIPFMGVKPCARCRMIGINQQTAEWNKEPMKTLASYRTKNNKVFFGQNLLCKGNGKISVGDTIEAVTLKTDFMILADNIPFYSLV